MGFQDAISGGGEGFNSPWMGLPRGGDSEGVPLEVKLAYPGSTRPGGTMVGFVGSGNNPARSSGPTKQGGGPIIGGGMMPGFAEFASYLESSKTWTHMA